MIHQYLIPYLTIGIILTTYITASRFGQPSRKKSKQITEIIFTTILWPISLKYLVEEKENELRKHGGEK